VWSQERTQETKIFEKGKEEKMVELKIMSGSAASQGAGCNADVTMLFPLQQYINTVGMATRADILAHKRL
jgi:hypothetical protein